MLGWLHQAAAGEKELVAALLATEGDDGDEEKNGDEEKDGDKEKNGGEEHKEGAGVDEGGGGCGSRGCAGQDPRRRVQAVQGEAGAGAQRVSHSLGGVPAGQPVGLLQGDAAVRSWARMRRSWPPWRSAGRRRREPSRIRSRGAPPSSGRNPRARPTPSRPRRSSPRPSLSSGSSSRSGPTPSQAATSMRRTTPSARCSIPLSRRAAAGAGAIAEALRPEESGGAGPTPATTNAAGTVPPAYTARWAKEAYLLNCLNAMAAALGDFPGASAARDSLNSRVASLADTIADDEAGRIPRSSGGGGPRAHRAVPGAADGPRRDVEDPALELGVVGSALDKLVDEVSASPEPVPAFDEVLNPRTRVDLRGTYVGKIIEAYTLVYMAVLDPNNGYRDAKSAIRHGPDALGVLLN